LACAPTPARAITKSPKACTTLATLVAYEGRPEDELAADLLAAGLTQYYSTDELLKRWQSPSPAARAAMQLARVGKQTSPGQRVRFLLTRGWPGVHAWDLLKPPDPRTVDVPRYYELLLHAVKTILEPVAQHYDSSTIRSVSTIPFAL